MADYNNTIFKPRKNSGYVIKFMLTSDRANREDKDREQTLARGGYLCDWELELNFHKTLYIRRTYNSMQGLKTSTRYSTEPWYFGKDVIAFIYKVNDYDFPCAAYVKGKFVTFDNLSDEDRDTYRSYSGSYIEDVNPLWVRENNFKF